MPAQDKREPAITDRALLEILKTENDALLVIEKINKRYRAAIRCYAHPSFLVKTHPLFDPVNGSVELAGYGSTPDEALAALREVLSRFFE